MGLLSKILTEEELLNYLDTNIANILGGKAVELRGSSKDKFKDVTQKVNLSLINKDAYLKTYFIKDKGNSNATNFSFYNYFRLQMRVDDDLAEIMKRNIKPGYIALEGNDKSYEFKDFMSSYEQAKKRDSNMLLSINLNFSNKFKDKYIDKKHVCRIELPRGEDTSMHNLPTLNKFSKASLRSGSGSSVTIPLHFNALFDSRGDKLFQKLFKYNNLLTQYLYVSMLTDEASNQYLTEYVQNMKKALRSDVNDGKIPEDEKEMLMMLFDLSSQTFEHIEKINSRIDTDSNNAKKYLEQYHQNKAEPNNIRKVRMN